MNQTTEEVIKEQEELQEELQEEVAVATVANGDTVASPVGVSQYRPRNKFKYGCYLFIKRAFDLISAGLLFLVLLPFILILLFVKWVEDFHNPIYVSWRVGKNGKPFRIFKIRTMRVGADKEKKDLAEQNEADGPVFKIKNDPRITKVGKFYRKFSLDELLQLLNIINGTMSVVGPRPPLQAEVDEYEEWQLRRLEIKGGLLCLWQIQKNRNSLRFDEWVRLDIEYIEKQSLWLDLKIIFKGLFMVIFDHSGE